MICLCFGFTVETLEFSKPTSRPLDSSDMMVSHWQVIGHWQDHPVNGQPRLSSPDSLSRAAVSDSGVFHLIAVQLPSSVHVNPSKAVKFKMSHTNGNHM